ncbi:MAG: carbamate kinase [candidate division Zixibacteria bacterium]|nr:carbamate kinase [candidate division Zixibacteria bacterium]
MSKSAVVALGGNAITRKEVEDTIANQFANTRNSLHGVIELIRRGYNLVITHGNGPQVGNAILRVELARGKAPILPLGICVADTEGGMGYMIGQSLYNRLHRDNLRREVVTIITQIEVDRNDPEMQNPTKYIGQFYSEQEAVLFQTERGWAMKEDSNRGWRRVVPSPIPRSIIEGRIIKQLVDAGVIVIAAGGGGIPVYYEADGTLEGVDVVIDKDRASALLAHEIGAEMLIILTGTDKVALNFGKPNQRLLDRITLAEAEQYLKEGHFPSGSMGPKIEAAIDFLKRGGATVVISSIEKAAEAVFGNAGTVIERG